ncbi:protein kinase [Corallococcus macrosporus]|uniref:Protein kinase n=2 Tax=Corallococcus macrosporus TaxID=35 RepID=A0ABS3D4S7_9BACT|nr:protein kinase [Corallococcus macrosporus]
MKTHRPSIADEVPRTLRKTSSADTTPLADPLLSSQIGDFTVDERIGAGGMGVVYRATHSLIGKQAAIKVLRAELVSPKLRERLLVEARAVNAIRHPGIIDIFGFGTLPDGRSYVVMELLEGRPLSELLTDRKRLDVPTSLWMLDQILSALGAAHRAGVVHRDLKPANVFLVEPPNAAPTLKLVDFGIAKLLESKDSPTTLDGSVLGTPEFMAPEQIRGGTVGPATDLYALGIMAFQMLTGVRPFQGDPVQVMFAHVDQIPPLPSARAEGIPPELDTLVLQLLAKDPTLRPASAEAVQQQLQRIPAEARTQTFARPPGLKPKVPAPSPAPAPKPAVARVPTRAPMAVADPEDVGTEALQALRKTPSRGWMLGGMALLVGLGSGAWWLSRPAATVEQPPAQPTVEARPDAGTPDKPPFPPEPPPTVVTTATDPSTEKEKIPEKVDKDPPKSHSRTQPSQGPRKPGPSKQPPEPPTSGPGQKPPTEPQGFATVTDVTEVETSPQGPSTSAPAPAPEPVTVARAARPELPQDFYTQRLLAKRLNKNYEALYARNSNGSPPPALLNSLLALFQEAAGTETELEADRVFVKVELWEKVTNQLVPSTNAPVVTAPPPPVAFTPLPGPHAIPSGPRPTPRRATADEVKLANRLEQYDQEFRRRTKGASEASGLEWELWKFHERASQELTADDRGKLYMDTYKWMDVLKARFPL